MTGQTVQWIIVGVILLAVVAGIVRYILNLMRWSRGLRRGDPSTPPCCGGKRSSTPGKPCKSLCPGCSADCPLASGHAKNQKAQLKKIRRSS